MASDDSRTTNSFLQKIFLKTNLNVGQNEQQIFEISNRNIDLGGRMCVAEMDVGVKMTVIDTQKRQIVFDWCFGPPNQSIPFARPSIIISSPKLTLKTNRAQNK